MNHAQMADTKGEQLQLLLRMRRLKQITDEIEDERKTSDADYRAALRRINAVKAKLGCASGSRQSGKTTMVSTTQRSGAITLRPGEIVTQDDPRFAAIDAQWKAAHGSRHHKMITFGG
jgi:hypothetical protein